MARPRPRLHQLRILLYRITIPEFYSFTILVGVWLL